MAYTNPLDELKRLRMQTEQEYLRAREFATSRAKEIKTSPPDIGALRRRESEAGDYSRQKDPIVEAFQQPKKERSPILDAFSTGVRTFSYITDRLISGATFGLSDVVGKAVESGISKISGKDIDISRGYQPSETVKAVGDVAGIGGGLLTGGMLLKGIKTVAAPALSKVATSITQFAKGIHPAVKAGAGIGAGATAFETTRGAIDPDYADRRDTFPSQFGAGLRVGTGQLLETAGAVAKWKEQDKLAKTLTSKGEAIREGFDEAEPVEFSWRAWFDPDFYAVNVARTVPMTAALIPAMFAGWKIGGGTGARLGLGPFARTVAASLGGATLSRPLESALEAGDTYDQLYQQEISKGKSEEEAHNIADRGAQEVFNKNLALVGMDAAQLAVAFTPYTRMGGRIGSMLANRIGQAGIAAGKLAFEAGSEAGEEALQYAFQQQAMGEEIDWSSPEAKEAMAIGGLFGGVLGGAGVVNDAVKARMAANLPPEQKTILSQSIENKLEQGMTEEEAVEQAFDEFAETPEGKEAIREITAEVANEIEEEVWKQIEALESFEMESAVEDKSPTAEEEIQPVSVEEPTAIESQEQVEIPEPVTLEEQVQPMATEEQVLPVAETETVAVPTPEVAADIAEPESQPEAVAETVSMPVEEKAVVEPAVEPVEEPVTEPSAPATEAVPVKKDRSKITATHLRKQAQAMQKTIDAKRNPAIAKQRPTARRANIAAGMANEADTLEDIQTKVNIVAQAIEDRTIPESLAGITKKTQVETLRKLLKEKYPKMGATLGKYSAQDLLAATEGVKGSAQLRKNLKAKLDALGQDEYVIPIRTKAELQEIETLVRMAGDKLDNYIKRNIKDSLADFKRLLELGIDSQDKLDQAISDFKELTQDDGRPKEITKEQKIKAAERELIGTKIEGYFPTPKAVVERMLEEADIQPGMKVLEPSAGKGNIADAIREAEPQADLDVIEINSRLRDILEAKGHNIVGYDFLEYNEAKYDRIVMNPPFEKGQDIDHVKHAYDLLKPGGRVVSIMSEGPFFRGDKKAAEFRDWLEENEGTSEKLPKGSFESSERPTGVATRLVVINKPEAVTETVQAQVPVQTEEITPLPTEVTTQIRIPSGELSTEQLVQRIKTLSNDPKSAYGLFVKERDLKPEINAKQFMQIWESVSANPHVRNLTTSFQPTHIDTLTGKQVQITDDGNVYKLVWENGLTGSDPKTLFDVKRYEPLGKVADTSLPADKEIESLLNEMQSRQSEEAVSLVFTIDKTKQAFNAVVDKWTFKGKLDSSGWAKQYQRAKIWEKNGKFRIYVPHDEYSQAGYVTMDANDVPKGSTSGQHKGLYYSAVSSQKEKTLISFIDDIIEYLNKEVKTSERAVEDQTAVAVGEGQVVRKGRISRIDSRLPLRDFRDKEYGEVNITRGKVYSGEPRTNIGENVLRKHQKDGVEHAIAAIDNYGGFILADGTGAGKTMQELVVAAHYAQHHNTVLIVVPNRAIINKAFRQDAQTLGIEGLLNVLGGESLPIKGKINLTTYASLKKVAGTDIDYVIFDEAHYLKNKGSAQSRTGKSVAAKAKGVLYATATPIDKAEHIHYLEGTGLFKNNSFSGIMRELGYAYEEMSIGGRTIGKWVRKATRLEAESLLEAFFDELGDLGLIIKREISMDNIEVFVKTVPLPSEVHSKLAQIESYYNSLNVGEGLQKALALMAQRRWQEPYKVNVVMETIDNELKAGRQVVVFAARIEDSEVESIVLTDKSEGTLETLRSQLEEKGINVSAIYGSGNVDKAISDFQKGKTKVALVTPQKGGAGLSLDDVTGDAPRTMIIMTPPFSAVDNVQMAGRINRLTTKSKGRIIYLIADTDIDAWNMEIIASKIRSLNASVKGDVIKLDLTQTQKESAQQGIKFKAQPGTPEADLEVLRRAIKQRRLGPIAINKVELAPEALSRPEFQATSAIAEKLGLRVVAFKGKGARGIQSGRTIYLNASLKDPLDYVFWHEVGHTMEVTHPEHYDRLMGIALDHIQDVHKLQSHYKAQDYALENMPHEFAADVFAESLTTPGFFERLKNEAPELIKPLLEAIEQLIARIKQAISKDDSVLPYLRDVEVLQERIRKEVVEPYFKDAMSEKQFVEMFGHKWQEPVAKTKAETRIDPTETPEFKRWFGDSVVTDNVANPLEVYHGTGAEFSVFDMSRGGERWEGDGKIAEMISKMGAFFTGNKEAAMEWANINLRSGEEPKVISAYLSIQNPKEYRSEYISPQDRLDILAEIKKRFDNRELPQEFDFDDYAYGFKDKKIPDSLDMLTVDILQSGGPENLKQQLIEEGYDGIIIHGSRDGDFGTQYVAFFPTQIKSVHNQGTWDPTNPDIRYKPERSKKPVKETKFNLQNPEVQERMEAAAGIPQKTTRDKLTEVFEAFKRKISREYEWLPRTGEFAELRQALLNLGKQKSVSADKTIRGLKEIVKPMNEYEYSLFTYKVIFDDLAHEAAEGRLLPFGLTPEILEIEKAAVDRDVEQNAKVKEAIRKRKQIWDRIKREYIQANEAIGHKVDEKLKKDDYYRHQVLEYANAKGITGTGRKLRTPSYRGYLRKREGSTFDINTDYLQAEFEVMAQMHYDTMIARTIQVVKQHYDIVPQLKAQAIAINNENIMPIFEQMAESNVTAQKLYRMTLNKKQAIALDQLEKMAAKGELPDTPNGKYADVIEYLSARYLERELKKDSAIDTDISFERVMSEDEYNKRLFEYLGWLTKQPTSQAKIAALTYFKGRKEKERFIKDRLGDAYVTWQDLIPEGYVEWQPREGSVFYMASSIPEHVAEALYSEVLESVGVTGDMLKKVLAKGQKFPAMVVKEEVALTLDNLVTSINKDNPFVQVLRAWKQWQLISPKRFLKYNIRNFTGDLDALITGNLRAILKVPQAWAELRKAFFSKGHEMSPMLEEWFKRGGFETLFQAQEIYDINRNRQFRHLMELKLKRTPVENLINAPKNAWYKYWDFARKATDFREALLRYACFLDYAEQIQNSPDGNPLNYGASNREEIKGLKDPLDRAFKLANELLGAYDEVSVVGVWLSDHLLPFWRWNEVNFVRYIRIFKNAYQDGKLLAAVGRRVAGTAIRSVVLAMHIGWFVLKLCAFSAMITAWNMLFFRDEEDDLPEDVKSRFHIILGRDDQGNVLYFSRLGALQDFLDWFGLDSAHIHIQNLLSGKRNVQEVVTEMAKAPLVKIGTALGPHVTLPVGLFLKQQLYPDPLEPRRVRDEWEFIFDSFGLKDEYRELTGKPTMGYGRSLYNVVAYKSDPLQAAYYSIKDEKIRFMKKLNKQSYDYAVVESPKSDALYNFKLALRYKDAEAAKKYLLEYFYAGGTTRGLKQSLKSLHPLHGLKDAEKKAFILQLDSEGREDLVKALEYYRSILNPE